MRLIDGNALMDKICKQFNIPDDWDGDIAEPLQTVIDIIDNEPTAYDTEKVVEEIEKLKNPYDADQWFSDKKIRKAQEIVRKGGGAE